MAGKYIENGESYKFFHVSKDKKNIFLIGDSICLGYGKYVKVRDEAKVFYLADNCRNSQYIICSLREWQNMFDNPDAVDMIHFNCGHWDAAHFSGTEFSLTSPEEYRKNLHMIIFLLRKFFKNAKLIFATTTPMNPKRNLYEDINPRTTEEISKYNKIATEVMEEEGIEINDLFSFASDFDESCFEDVCHFTKDTNKLLGAKVAENLKKNGL